MGYRRPFTLSSQINLCNGTVRDYGVYDEEGGCGTRATFNVDKEGRIRHIEQGKER